MVYGVYFQEDDPNGRAPRTSQFRAVSHDYLPTLGVRVALGATAADIAALVVGGAARLAAAGALLGLAGAAALTRVLRGLLFDVSPADPATFGGVVAALGAVAMVASFVPARRAARVDPVQAIRQD